MDETSKAKSVSETLPAPSAVSAMEAMSAASSGGNNNNNHNNNNRRAVMAKEEMMKTVDALPTEAIQSILEKQGII